MIPQAQQKIGAYLLKNTIGKLLQDVDWNMIEIQLRKGVVTIRNCALNSKLLNESFQQKGIKFVKGTIGFLSVSIPWSSLFQESCSMVIQDLEMELETTTPTEPTIQSPVLSSSFHFADEFKRSFDDEAPEMKDSESLTELAQIIENIIGKVSVTLDRVTIKLKNSNSWRKDLNDTFVLLKMDRISLCDHINQKESIPASLLDNQNDIISRVVKYLELSRCSVLLEREQKSLVLFHLSLAYVRLLFSQQDYLDDSVHSSVYGMANSVILGDFHIAVQSEMITLFTRTQDLIDLIGFMDAQQKESLKKEKQRSSNDPVMFQLFLGEMVAYLAGNEEDVGCINSEKIDTVEHLKFQLQNIKVDNHYSNFPSFSITSSFTDCYSAVLEKWVDFESLRSSAMFEPSKEVVREDFELTVSKLVPRDISLPTPLSCSLKLPRLFLKIGYEDVIRWKKLLSPSNFNSGKQGSHKDKSNPIEVSIYGPLLRLAFILAADDSVPTPILDLDHLVITYNTLLGFKAPKTNIELSRLYFGLANSSITEFRHFFVAREIAVDLTDNRDRSSESGLTEDYMKLKHKQSRDNTFWDDRSAKSWSDFGDSSSSPTSLTHRKQESSEQPPLSKLVVQWSTKSFNFELDQQDLLDLFTVVKAIQKITMKDPPEPSQPSLSLVGNMEVVQVRLYSTTKDNLFDHQLECRSIDLILSMNSHSAKNLISFEVWCTDIFVDTIDFGSSSNWRCINTIKSATENSLPAVHFIFSQNDDFEVALRQATATLLLNNVLLNVPSFSINVPILPQPIETTESTNSLHSSTDVVVVLTNSGMTHAIGDTSVLVLQEYLKVQGNMIQDSPTQGLEIVTTLTTMYISIDPTVPISCQREHTCLSDLEFVKITSLDTLKFQLRLNKQCLPAVDCDVYFKQLTIETCSDSLQALISFTKGFAKTSNTVQVFINQEPRTDRQDVDTFEMVEEGVFIPEYLQGDEDDPDWQLDFEQVLSKEEVVIDTITVFPAMEQFVLDPKFMTEKEIVKDVFEQEISEFKVRVHDSNVNWRLLPGVHFESRCSTPLPYENVERPTAKKPFVEVHLINIGLSLDLFPQESLTSKSLIFSIRDIEVIDLVPASQWRKFMGYKAPEEQEPPRETDSDMLKVKWTGIRASQGEEHRLSFSMLPLQFHIDQDTLMFLEEYFEQPAQREQSSTELSETEVTPESNPIFFQLCEIDSVTIQMDYKPKHVNYQQIQKGQFAELINFLHLDGAKIYLKPVTMTGIFGWSRLLQRIESIWLPHVKQTQIQNLAGGVQGIHSLVNVGSGIADLVLLPIEQFQKDGRIFRGISRGTTSFLKATTLESARLGSKIASGAQQLLDQADRSSSQRSSKAETPKDVKQGLEMGFQSINDGIKSAAKVLQNKQFTPQAVPVAMIQPLKGITSALASTLIGLQNTIDKTQQRRFQEKYKQ